MSDNLHVLIVDDFHVATAQRYLSALVDDGSIEIHLRYGNTGRPEHRYGLAR